MDKNEAWRQIGEVRREPLQEAKNKSGGISPPGTSASSSWTSQVINNGNWDISHPQPNEERAIALEKADVVFERNAVQYGKNGNGDYVYICVNKGVSLIVAKGIITVHDLVHQTRNAPNNQEASRRPGGYPDATAVRVRLEKATERFRLIAGAIGEDLYHEAFAPEDWRANPSMVALLCTTTTSVSFAYKDCRRRKEDKIVVALLWRQVFEILEEGFPVAEYYPDQYLFQAMRYAAHYLEEDLGLPHPPQQRRTLKERTL
eukprot:CAMPEP_0206458892 /NCGR_PEP_ID=MMETSP0324_2-20121206/23846_1 /ASSEMBLY_ACC=CAM_ASM_000836 /TAXON_ID=2866 /ORGANISM="Crypthecodinium cohnii, Strain Seligo" /LENGTH=259 /DNA_ID=CAMNT_0053930329 /DNA_START=59 /DNA_END=838 /DNA_ORIENTATION=-